MDKAKHRKLRSGDIVRISYANDTSLYAKYISAGFYAGHYYPDGFHYVILQPSNKVERKFIARGDVRAKQIEIIDGELIKLV